jgi:hypothetical protein
MSMQHPSTPVAFALACLGLSACGRDPETEAKKTQCRSKAAGPAYNELAQVPDGGSVRGTITYTGALQDTTYTPSKDFEVCGQGQKPEGTLLRVSGGKLQNAVVVIDDVAEGKKLPDEKDFVVDNLKCMFNPRVRLGYAGGKLIAKNSDKILHNIHPFVADGNKNIYNIPLPDVGEIKKDMKKTGLLSVRCDAHGWMQGWLYVAAHPYVAITGEDGSYAIDDLPAGEYTVRVWHERAAPLGKEKTAKLKVVKGEVNTLDFALE